ncbi:MAG TPA: hypothetical protein VI072_11565 [Polyangiaceae bacterium]
MVVCARTDTSGTVRPTLVKVTAAGAPGVVARLDAYQGHDDRKVVRASVSAQFPDRDDPIVDLPTSYPAGALEWVLQMYDLGAQRWVDLKSIRSRPIEENSWERAVVEGQLTAEVPGNTSVRLELRSNGAGRRVRIDDARLFAPICVRDQVSGKCQ